MRIAIFLAATLALTACDVPEITNKAPFKASAASISEAKAAASYNLKDPSSAQFRNVRGMASTVDGSHEKIVCGEVNGKNSFGGYAGFTPFVYSLRTKRARIAPTGTDSDLSRAIMISQMNLIC